jgi:uncharacterized delta-60 repeat protein
MPRSPKQGRRALAAACVLVLALVPAAQARLGDLDAGFDGDGIAQPAVGAGAARFEAVTVRPDGRVLAAGYALNGASAPEAVLAQLTPAGALDPSFGLGGSGVRRILAGTSIRLHDVALDSTGGILAAGDQQVATTAPVVPILHRFDANGVPGAVATIGSTAGEATAVHVVDDRTVLVAGWHTAAVTGQDVFFVARFVDGALDVTFAPGGVRDIVIGTDARAQAMAVDAGGTITLAGWAFTGGQTSPALARVSAAGTLLSTVSPVGAAPGGSTAGRFGDVAVDGLGRVTAAGSAGDGEAYAVVARRLASGAADPTFGNAGATYERMGGENDAAAARAVALTGGRAVLAGAAGPGRGPFRLMLASVDAGGIPEPALGGSPPGWRTFPPVAEALAAAAGPSGTTYTAGVLGSPTAAIVTRHAGNAAPSAALAAPATIVAGAPATFDAVGSSDPEGEALRFAFDLDGNGSYEFDGGGNPLALRSFPAAGTYTAGVRVTDPRGGTATATTGIVVTPATRPVPQPVLGRQGVATPKRGIVRVRLPGTKKFVPITDVSAIPNGTEIDARRGRVLLTVLHDATGRLDGAVFYAGRFIFHQGKGKVPITTLRLSGGSFAACGKRAAARRAGAVASAAQRKRSKGRKPPRKLWGDGRGRFRTKGRYGAATVRGTKWLTADRCDGTLVRVERGKVDVEDLIRPRVKIKRIRAGGQILVRARRK